MRRTGDRKFTAGLAASAVCLLLPFASRLSAAAPAGDLPLEQAYEAQRAAILLGQSQAADDLQRRGFETEAAEVRAWRLWLFGFGRQKSTYCLLTSQRDTPSPAPLTPAQEGDGLQRLTTLRREYADKLFALAQRAAVEKEFSLALAWTYQALRENPRHAAAAKVLGLQEFEGRQLSAFEITKRRAGQVWNPTFGWLPREHVLRYEAGERYLSGRWVTAAEDARIHATIERGWNVDTENFRIVTNHSLEEGVRLASQLEKMHQVWRQVFARYHTAEAEWTRIFAGGAPREYNRRRYNVVHFRDRAEYVAALQKREPKVGLTSGIFMNDDDKAYFFADPQQSNDPFVFHEVTHQLFSLSKPTTLKVGARGNFWIVEGVACHFESLALHDDYAELGGIDNPRMKAASFRLLQDKFFMPTAEFSALSLQQMQSHPRIATLYSQASGLASFLLEGSGGKYREATVDYLHAIYGNRDTPTTLSELTGRPYAELDAEYRAYIAEINKRPQAVGPTP